MKTNSHSRSSKGDLATPSYGERLRMNSSQLRMQHSSLQATDRPNQQRRDVDAIFKGAEDLPIKSGTESGPETALHEALKEAAADYNHRIIFGRGNWIAVDREIIKKNTVNARTHFVASNRDVVGPGHDLVFPTFEFDHVDDGIGRVGHAAVHLATKGSRPGDPNFLVNGLYVSAATKWMTEAAKGSAIAFISGDFNSNDKHLNWPRTRAWTSMGDELRQWPNTGHGPIDGFGSFNKDGRVSAVHMRVLNDEALPLFSDHFVVRGTWSIQHLLTTSRRPK